MAFDGKQYVRVTKRMMEATGYLELGMTQHALDRLTGIGELGPLEAEVELIQSRNELQQVEGDLIEQEAALKQLIGLEDDVVVRVEDELPVEPFAEPRAVREPPRHACTPSSIARRFAAPIRRFASSSISA